MELYKYTSVQNGINILTNLEIRFTQPNALNDVFEMFPNLLTDISEQAFEILYEEFVSKGMFEKLWENTLDEFHKSVGKKYPYIFEHKEVADNFLKKLFNTNYLKGRSVSEMISQKFRENSNDIRLQLINQYLIIINSNVGILSLSESNNETRLWGNYANSNTGVAICFDKSHPFFQDIKKVIYVENREAVNLNDIILGKSNPHIRDVFYTKSKDWEYEKEYRKFGFFNFAKRKLEKNDSFDYPFFLFDVPMDAISGIILGNKIKQNDEDEIRQIIKRDNYNIYTKKAIISTSDYKIIIK